MKKQKINREVVLQYIYDYGFEEACLNWKINKDQLLKIIDPDVVTPPKIRELKDEKIQIDPSVANIINNYYDELYKKYVRNDSTLFMSQTNEDIFHNTLLKVLYEVTDISEKSVLDLIDYRFKMVSFQTIKDHKSFQKTESIYANIKEIQ